MSDPRRANLAAFVLTSCPSKGLREHLLAASGSGSAPPPYPSAAAPPHPGHEQGQYPPSESASPHDQHLDPNVTGQQLPYAMSGDSSAVDDGLGPDSRKGKRELSTSKRAAQNRAAQVHHMQHDIPIVANTDSSSAHFASAKKAISRSSKNKSRSSRTWRFVSIRNRWTCDKRLILWQVQLQGSAERELSAARIHLESPITASRESIRLPTSTVSHQPLIRSSTSRCRHRRVIVWA